MILRRYPIFMPPRSGSGLHLPATLSVPNSSLLSVLPVVNATVLSVLSVANAPLLSVLSVANAPLLSILSVFYAALLPVLPVVDAALLPILPVFNTALLALGREGLRSRVAEGHSEQRGGEDRGKKGTFVVGFAEFHVVLSSAGRSFWGGHAPFSGRL